MIYLDASALVTLVLGRPNRSALREYFLQHPAVSTCTSTVGFIETVRSCDLIGDFPHLMRALRQDHDELAVTAAVRDRAAVLPGRLKTLDAIHVATAESLGSELTALVTYDKKMADVAQAVGLPLAMPGVAD